MLEAVAGGTEATALGDIAVMVLSQSSQPAAAFSYKVEDLD